MMLLKTCPFCGKDPHVDESHWNDPSGGATKSMFRVICPGCGTSQTLKDSREDAAKLWNRRFPAARDDEEKAGTVTLALSKYEMIVSERAALMGQVSTLIGKLSKIEEMIRSFQRGKAGDADDD